MRKIFFENVAVEVNTSLRVMRFDKNSLCTGIGWHLHPEYELVYIRNGNGVLNIDVLSMPYEDGVLLFLGPDIPHTDFANHDHPDSLEVVIQFPASFLEERLALLPELNGIRQFCERSRRVLLFPKNVQYRMDELFANLSQKDAAGRLLGFLECLRQLKAQERLARELFPAATSPRIAKPQDAQRLERIFDRINNEYQRPLSSRQLAEELGMTTNSFCRFFKASTHKSFLDFLNNYRLERAKDLLSNSQRPIKEVMFSCGFRDAAYFSRLFRRRVGVSPTKWRFKNQK